MRFEEHPLNIEKYPFAPNVYQSRVCEPLVFNMDPEFTQFIKDVQNMGNDIYVRVPLKEEVVTWSNDQNKSRDDQYPRLMLVNVYSPGGTTGENGGDRSRAYRNEDLPPTFECWSEVLQLFWPDISSRERVALDQVVYSSLHWNVNEYYGDSTDYMSEQVDLEKLFLVLKNENKLTPVPYEKKDEIKNRFDGYISQEHPSGAPPVINKVADKKKGSHL